MSVTLKDKFLGCIVGANYTQCDDIKIISKTIIEKGDRVTAEDIREIWCRDFDSDNDENLKIAKTKVPARELGRYRDGSGLSKFSTVCQVIGLINAGDIGTAIQDAMEVGQMYQTANSRGIKWACVTAAAIAAAAKPDADVDSVLNAIFDNLDERQRVDNREDGWYAAYAGVNVVDEIKGALKYTKDCRNFDDLRKAFEPRYDGIGMPYNTGYANEVVTKAICVFKMTNGNLADIMQSACALGRDSNAVIAIAGAISGTLNGTGSVNNISDELRESADGLYNAFKARLHKLIENADLMGY
jgi:ADP-ribosylglycohydrolase